ncbi:MAG TPA: hypothetical protein VIM57_10150 [Luteolibacter sp.]
MKKPPAKYLMYAALFLVAAFSAYWGVSFLTQRIKASSPQAIAARINLEELRNLEVRTVEDLELHAYAYKENETRTIPSLSSERLNTRVDGRLPAFKFKEFTFVILHKWVNYSWGVAYGKGTPPESPAEFSFEPLQDGVWIWFLDLEGKLK